MRNTNNSLMLTGVIGCGNAGSQVADLAQMKVLTVLLLIVV